MPQSVYPVKGWLGSCNHKTVGTDYPYYSSSYFASSYRYRWLKELMEMASETTAEDHWRYQQETVNTRPGDGAHLRPNRSPRCVGGWAEFHPETVFAKGIGRQDPHGTGRALSVIGGVTPPRRPCNACTPAPPVFTRRMCRLKNRRFRTAASRRPRFTPVPATVGACQGLMPAPRQVMEKAAIRHHQASLRRWSISRPAPFLPTRQCLSSPRVSW